MKPLWGTSSGAAGFASGFSCDLCLPGHPEPLCIALLIITHRRSLPGCCPHSSRRSHLGFWQRGCWLHQHQTMPRFGGFSGDSRGLRGAGRCGRLLPGHEMKKQALSHRGGHQPLSRLAWDGISQRRCEKPSCQQEQHYPLKHH